MFERNERNNEGLKNEGRIERRGLKERNTGRRRGFERKGTLCEKDANLADPRLVLDSGLSDFDLQEKEKGRRKGQRRTRRERRSKGTRPHVGSADQAKAGIEVRELVSDLLEERERVGKSVLRGCRGKKKERENGQLYARRNEEKGTTPKHSLKSLVECWRER